MRGLRRRVSLERSKVSSACGSGTSAPVKAAKAANSRRRPSLVASAMNGSMWSVKNLKRRLFPYPHP